MIRGINIVLFVISIFFLIGVYSIKFQSEAVEEEKMALARTIEQQQGELSVLQADWAFFSQPSYISQMVERHSEVLNLQILESKQYGSIEDIPMRPEIIDDSALTALFAALEEGIDPIGDKLAELMAQ
ncbi:hypothetical protein MNBD_ALPHA11-1964 [hydrothermal vent metagenome]|uniref:Cell division protein FtsL n=1 Tax=hydrothermal vent metagenome TaxID=652676 RepID=A0A3B0U7M3_9ZZZZ